MDQTILNGILNDKDCSLLFSSINRDETIAKLQEMEIPKQYRENPPYWNIFFKDNMAVYLKYDDDEIFRNHKGKCLIFLMKKNSVNKYMKIAMNYDYAPTGCVYC